MRTVSYRIGDLSKAVIHIGRVAENEYTRVQIDAGEIFAEYPAASASMTVQPPEGSAYPATVTRDGNLVIWDVKDSDLTADGNGEIQLTFTNSAVVVKSAIGRISVCRSIVASGEAPDPVQDWISDATDVLEALEDAIPEGGTQGQVLAKASDEDYDLEWVDQTGGGGGTGDYNDLTNKPQINGTTLSGNNSLSDLGIASANDLSAKYTKPASGIPAEDIASGVIPVLTDLIDDTAGEGDTDVTFSADKLTSDFSDVLNAITQNQNDVSALNTASNSDIGKYFKVKTVTDGKIAEVEFDDPGGGGSFSGVIELDAENQTAELGEELASGTGWVLGSGWTGSFAEGFTHSSGTAALEFPISGNEEGKMYLVSFNSSVDATVTPNFYVTIGGSDEFPLYGMPQPYKASIVSKGTANLKFIPVTTYTGKISDISIKEVTAISVPYMVTLDTSENNSIEFRSGTKQVGNIFIGRNAGQWNVTGFGNTAVGDEALSHVIGGFWNTGLGITALRENTNGSRNVGIGYGALQANICGHRNIAVGTFALISNTTGYQNVAVGADSMDKNTTGYNNVALGFQAMYNLTTGSENVSIGNNTAGALTTGTRNIIIGQRTLGALTTGSYNIGMGYSVMPNTTGQYNVGIGMNSLYRNTGGNYNVAIGFQAGYGSNSAGQERNVFIGPQAGLNIYNSVLRNVFIGYQAGQTLVTGSDNVCIGYGADVPASSTSKYTDINEQIKGSKVSGSEWTQVLGDFIVMGKDGVKRQIVFNSDNTVTWQTVT